MNPRPKVPVLVAGFVLAAAGLHAGERTAVGTELALRIDALRGIQVPADHDKAKVA
jgi:hypothetical protein